MPRPPSQPFANDLSDEALALMALVAGRHERNHLRGFLGFLSKTGRSVTDASAADLDAYGQELVRRGVERAHQAVRNAALAWGRMQARSPAWPQTALPVPESRRPRSAGSLDLPASLHDDIAAYLRQAGGDDLFDAGSATPLADATCVNMRRRLYRLAFIAAETGVPVRDLRSLTDLVDRYAPILRRVWDDAGRKKNDNAAQLARQLRTVAAKWVGSPPDTIDKIAAAERKMRPVHTGMVVKNKAKLRQFLLEDNAQALLRLPQKIFRSLDRSRPTVTDALRLQAAIGIGLLPYAPMRAKNLAGLDFTRHFDWLADGTCVIVIPAGEVKNGVDLTFTVPSHVTEMIRVYRDVYRPLLLKGRDTGALFISLNGRPKLPHELGAQLPKVIRDETGLDMHLHLFRHFVGFVFLRNNPGEYEAVRQLLGHKSLQTTVRFYTDLEVAKTFERYDAILDKMRKGGGARVRA